MQSKREPWYGSRPFVCLEHKRREELAAVPAKRPTLLNLLKSRNYASPPAHA